jgi:hypothetical protein
MQNYPNRRFVIFNVSELSFIDFSEVLETSVETVRKSVDETKTFVKYELPEPPTVQTLTTKSVPYTYEEFLVVLGGPDWTPVGADPHLEE